jgi:hypothetical protein
MDQFDTKGNATINTSSSVDALQLEACYPDPIRLLDTYGVLFRQSGPPTIALGSYDRRSVTGLRLRPYSGQTSTRSKVSYSDKPGARYRHYTGPFVISNPQLNCTCHYRGARYPSRWYLDSIWESLGSANVCKKILTQSKKCSGDMGVTSIHATALVNTRVFTQSRGRLSKAVSLKHAMPCAKKRLGCTTVTNP